VKVSLDVLSKLEVIKADECEAIVKAARVE
jgi:hypothetical protein